MRGHWVSETRKLNKHYQSAAVQSRFRVGGHIPSFVYAAAFGRSSGLYWEDGGNLYITPALDTNIEANYTLTHGKPICFVPCCNVTIGNKTYDFTNISNLEIKVSREEGNFVFRKETVNFQSFKPIYDENSEIIEYQNLYYNKDFDMNVLYYIGETENLWGYFRVDFPTLKSPKFSGVKVVDEKGVNKNYEDNQYFTYFNDLYVNYFVDNLIGYNDSGSFFNYNTSYSKRMNGPIIHDYNYELYDDYFPAYWNEYFINNYNDMTYIAPVVGGNDFYGSTSGIFSLNLNNIAGVDFFDISLDFYPYTNFFTSDNNINFRGVGVSGDNILIYASNDNFRCYEKTEDCFNTWNHLMSVYVNNPDGNLNFSIGANTEVNYE